MQRTLYGFWASPFMSFAAQVLLEADLPFEYQRVSPFNGDVYQADHQSRNSLGKIPSLMEPDGFTISESQAIARYLARTYPSAKAIYPIDNAKACAEIDTLNDFLTFSISGPVFNWLVVGGYFPQALQFKCADESEIFAKLSMIRVRDSIDRMLGTAKMTPFMLGDTTTMPDFQLYQILEAGKTFGAMFDMPALDLAAWDERLASLYAAISQMESSKKIATWQKEELPVTRKEIFEQFPNVLGPVIRDGLSTVLGHQV